MKPRDNEVMHQQESTKSKMNSSEQIELITIDEKGSSSSSYMDEKSIALFLSQSEDLSYEDQEWLDHHPEMAEQINGKSNPKIIDTHSLINAVDLGRLEMVRELITIAKVPVDIQDKDGDSALIIAAKRGYREMLRS